jgi:hypothetical protein
VFKVLIIKDILSQKQFKIEHHELKNI